MLRRTGLHVVFALGLGLAGAACSGERAAGPRPSGRSTLLGLFDKDPTLISCPAGEAQSTTAVIGPLGGVLAVAGTRVVIPVNGINRAVVQAVTFGRTLASDVRAVFITEDPEAGEAVRKKWERQVPGIPLVIVESPFRALVGPLTAYLDVLDMAWPPDKEAPITIVVLPEYVARHWWDRMLYNQTAKRLKAALVGREHTVIADVPYRRGH